MSKKKSIFPNEAAKKTTIVNVANKVSHRPIEERVLIINDFLGLNIDKKYLMSILREREVKSTAVSNY